jgi:hypothetical protein
LIGRSAVTHPSDGWIRSERGYGNQVFVLKLQKEGCDYGEMGGDDVARPQPHTARARESNSDAFGLSHELRFSEVDGGG